MICKFRTSVSNENRVYKGKIMFGCFELAQAGVIQDKFVLIRSHASCMIPSVAQLATTIPPMTLQKLFGTDSRLMLPIHYQQVGGRHD